MTRLLDIENAIIDRLTQGLGNMVRTVTHYNGELEQRPLPEMSSLFPLVWVGLRSIPTTEPYGTGRDKYKATGRFVIRVADLDVRASANGQPGATPGAVSGGSGTYLLIAAVRRLLTAQDLGMPIAALSPGLVRDCFYYRYDIQNQYHFERPAFSAYACEFSTSWVEETLPNEHWPHPLTPEDADAVFADYKGRLEGAPPDWLRTRLDYHLTGEHTPAKVSPDAQDFINNKKE